MDAFLEQLAKNVEQTILSALSSKLKEFAAHVVELPEMKEKNVTKEQILETWNSVSEFKISTSVATVVETGSNTPADKKSRAKTDKNKKCQVTKTRGDSKGDPCGKNCVVDTDFCPEHLKKNQKSPSNVAKESSEESAPAPSEPLAATDSVASANGGTCAHILETGKNKGNVCGKKATKDGKWCTVHGKKH
jgi:hypothetical protein